MVPQRGFQWNWSQNRNFGLGKMFSQPTLSDLNLDVSKDSVLESSGLDFGGLGPRFWSLRASILEVPGPTCRTKETHFGAFKFKRPKMQTGGLGLEDSGPQF